MESEMARRLPVNPRRRKVAPEARKRVVRACNSCNIRRVKCSGEQPCQQCRNASRECIYPTAEVPKDVILKAEVERLRKRCLALERSLQTAIPDEAARQELLHQMEASESPLQQSSVHLNLELPYTDDSETAEGRLLSDLDGNIRFLGETSGATFLDLLKHFMLTLVPLAIISEPGHSIVEDGWTFVASIGQYQTHDSRPLVDLQVDPFWLPSRTEMTLMLAELSYHVQDGNGDFLSGGIYYWGDLSIIPTAIALSPTQSDAISSNQYRYLALSHVSFALASQVVNPMVRPHDEHAGDSFFKRARTLLGNPLDAARFSLRDVPILAMMGFYLVERNRRDYAYMYVSLAIHIATTHGAFRHYVDEGSKRIFWTLYVLDRWLSCLMGRPPTLVDEAIRLPLPADAPSLPSPEGLRAHVQLARISGYIVCETFKVAPRQQLSVPLPQDIDKALKMLHDWLAHLPTQLQMPAEGFGIDSACCTLHMAYNQLVLLTTRPVFFLAVKKAVAERYIQGDIWQPEEHPQIKYIRTCSTAAHCNIALAQWVNQLYSSRKFLHASLHCVFNAAVILLLSRLLHPDGDVVEAKIEFAINLFEQGSHAENNYQKDCCQVLKDLKTLIDRFLVPETLDQSQRPYETGNGSFPALSSLDEEQNEQLNDARSRQYYLDESDDLYQELMTWTQNDDSQLHRAFRI